MNEQILGTNPNGVSGPVEGQKIKIGGKEIRIAHWQTIHDMEYQVSDWTHQITDIEYSALLFHNLGYNKMPGDRSWWWQPEPISVENVPKTVPITLPHMALTSIVPNNQTTLANLLTCIRVWGHDTKMKCGQLIDPYKSFTLPTKEEAVYNIQHQIDIRMKPAYQNGVFYWSKYDLLNERLHNLCPDIDETYFVFCIYNLEKYLTEITVDNPITVFTAGLINPAILFTVIRECEIESSKLVSAQEFQGKYPMLGDSDKKVKEFQTLLNKRLELLQQAFNKYGAEAFVKYVKEQITDGTEKDVVIPDTDAATQQERERNDRLMQLSPEEKRKFIADIKLDESSLGYIFSHLDRNSIPRELLETVLVTDSQGNKVYRLTKAYYDFLKRVLILFKQLETNYPELIRGDNIWIVTRPFFLTTEAFGLYHKDEGLFLLAYPDITFWIGPPLEAVSEYKNRYGLAVYLDPVELGTTNLTHAKGIRRTVLDSQILQGDEWKYAIAE